MRSLVMPIVLMILLILVLPANTLLMKASEPDQASESVKPKPVPETEESLQEVDSIILTECPSAFDLPLMLGRPAPCLATFTTSPD